MKALPDSVEVQGPLSSFLLVLETIFTEEIVKFPMVSIQLLRDVANRFNFSDVAEDVANSLEPRKLDKENSSIMIHT